MAGVEGVEGVTAMVAAVDAGSGEATVCSVVVVLEGVDAALPFFCLVADSVTGTGTGTSKL